MPNNGARIGAGATDTLANIRRGNNQTVVNNFSTFEHPDGTPLQVGSGKILYITNIRFMGTAANTRIAIGYGTAAVDDAVGAPAGATLVEKRIGIVVTEEVRSFAVFIPIPADKFPYFQSTIGGAIVSIEGIEI